MWGGGPLWPLLDLVDLGHCRLVAIGAEGRVRRLLHKPVAGRLVPKTHHGRPTLGGASHVGLRWEANPPRVPLFVEREPIQDPFATLRRALTPEPIGPSKIGAGAPLCLWRVIDRMQTGLRMCETEFRDVNRDRQLAPYVVEMLKDIPWALIAVQGENSIKPRAMAHAKNLLMWA